MGLALRRTLRFVLATDLDHTLVGHDGDEGHIKLMHFNFLWQEQFSEDGFLIYSTGRSPTKYMQLRNHVPMLTPDALVCSVGTELFWRQGDGTFKLDDVWNGQLSDGWDRDQIINIVASLDPVMFILQEDSEQRQHKISYHLMRTNASDVTVERLKRTLTERGVRARVVFSGGRDLDVLPVGAGKGNALSYILHQLKEKGCYPTDGVQVNGDSGNDIDLFEVEGVRGCVVANALPELKKWAEEHADLSSLFNASKECAEGIVEAMEHFSLLKGTITEDQCETTEFLSDAFTVESDNQKFTIGNNPRELRKLIGIREHSFAFIDGLQQDLYSEPHTFVLWFCNLDAERNRTVRNTRKATLLIEEVQSDSGSVVVWKKLNLWSREASCGTV